MWQVQILRRDTNESQFHSQTCKENLIIIIIIIYLFTAIGLLPGGSGYFTCIQNMKLVTIKFKSRGLHEKHVVAEKLLATTQCRITCLPDCSM